MSPAATISRQACSVGEYHRALSDNRDRYIAQSAGVAFGLLPEQQTDIHGLAREIRGAVAANEDVR